MASTNLRSDLKFRVTLRTNGSDFQIRAIPLSSQRDYAFADATASSFLKLSFPRQLADDEMLQFLLLTPIGRRAHDYKALQFVQAGILKPGYVMHLHDPTRKLILVSLEVVESSPLFSLTTGPRNVSSDRDVAALRRASNAYQEVYLRTLLDDSMVWTVPEVSKTHLVAWPLVVPSLSADGNLASNRVPTILELPAPLLTQVEFGSALNTDYVRKLAVILAESRGMDLTKEVRSLASTSHDYRESVTALAELLGDLCTAIQLNVEYVNDEDSLGAPIEKIKFPEMDNLGGEDCEGIAASSYRIFRFLQTRFDYATEAKSLLGFAQLVEFSNYYDPVLLTGSAANGRYFKMSSEMLTRSSHLISHVFCIAYPKVGQSAMLKPILLEGTNQTEKTVLGTVDSRARQRDHDMLKRLKSGGKTGPLLQTRKLEMQGPEEADSFYRYVVEWWDHDGQYLIKSKKSNTYGVPFADFMRTDPLTRSSVFELVPLPRISTEILLTAKQQWLNFIPNGFEWKPEAIRLHRVRGNLQLKRIGSRANAVQLRFQNISPVDAELIYDSVAEDLGASPLDMVMHLLVYDTPDARGGEATIRNTSKELRQEYTKHAYQISVGEFGARETKVD